MWQQLLRRIFGLPPEGAEYGRLGGGVMAYTARVVIVFCGMAGAIALALSHAPFFALVAIAMLVGVVVFFLWGTWRFADRHPDQTALGGAYWYRLREMQLGQKGQPGLPPSPQITDPDRPPPAAPKESPLIGAPDSD